MQKIKLIKEPKLEIKHQAMAHQTEAIKAIREKDYAAIFHEQGLGKTKIAIDLILYWLEKKQIDTVLLVVKKGLIKNWKDELEVHSYLKPRMLSQNTKENFHTFNSPARVMLTHYEVIKKEKERFKLFLKTREVAIILDESTKIKNPDSELTVAFFELAPLFAKRIIMTGTPIPNRPYDIWAQIHFLDLGEHLEESFIKFKKEFNLSNELHNNQSDRNIFEENLQKLWPKISKFSVRETKKKALIELPDKNFKTIFSDWEPNQFDLYRQVRDELRAMVIKDGIPTEDNAEDILKRLLRFIQIASNPSLVDESYDKEPGKIDSLMNLVESIILKNEKCIVWTHFIKNANYLQKIIGPSRSCKVHGQLSYESRNKSIDSFKNNENIKVLVATPGSAKEGLTLTVSNHVIFYDRTFNLDDYLQAQDRIHRISQTKTCYVYNLIMKDSIDEWVDALLEAKGLAAELTQGDISLNYYRDNINYNFGEMLKKILNLV